MPAKGSKKAGNLSAMDDGNEEHVEVPVQEPEEKISSELDNRLTRIKKVMEALAARLEPEQQQPPAKRRVVTRQASVQ